MSGGKRCGKTLISLLLLLAVAAIPVAVVSRKYTSPSIQWGSGCRFVRVSLHLVMSGRSVKKASSRKAHSSIAGSDDEAEGLRCPCVRNLKQFIHTCTCSM